MHSYRLLNEPIEEHSSGSRLTAIKAEGKFVKIGLQVIGAERSLMSAKKPPFHEGRYSMDSGEHFVSIHARPVDRCALVGIVSSSSAWIRGQSICVNSGAWFNMRQEKGSQGFGLRVGYDLKATTAKPFGIEPFHGHSNENLAFCSSAPFPVLYASHYSLVHLDITGQAIMSCVPNSAPKTMKHCPCSLVGAKTKKTVERLGRHSVLWRGHVPSRSKPYGEGRFRMMENCASRGRHPATARFAPPAAIFHAPPRPARTCWARKTRRPTHPVKVIKAGSIIRKPAEKVSVVSWVINTSLWTNLRFRCFHPGILALPHLYGYPITHNLLVLGSTPRGPTIFSDATGTMNPEIHRSVRACQTGNPGVHSSHCVRGNRAAFPSLRLRQ